MGMVARIYFVNCRGDGVELGGLAGGERDELVMKLQVGVLRCKIDVVTEKRGASHSSSQSSPFYPPSAISCLTPQISSHSHINFTY